MPPLVPDEVQPVEEPISDDNNLLASFWAADFSSVPAEEPPVFEEPPSPADVPALLPVVEPALLPVDEPALLPLVEPALLPVDEPALLPVDEPALLPLVVPALLPLVESSVFSPVVLLLFPVDI